MTEAKRHCCQRIPKAVRDARMIDMALGSGSKVFAKFYWSQREEPVISVNEVQGHPVIKVRTGVYNDIRSVTSWRVAE